MSFLEDVHSGSKRSENGAMNNFQDLQKVFIPLKRGFLMTKHKTFLVAHSALI